MKIVLPVQITNSFDEKDVSGELTVILTGKLGVELSRKQIVNCEKWWERNTLNTEVKGPVIIEF